MFEIRVINILKCICIYWKVVTCYIKKNVCLGIYENKQNTLTHRGTRERRFCLSNHQPQTKRRAGERIIRYKV